MNRYEVVIAQSARDDLSSIRQYIIEDHNDGYVANLVTDRILNKIEKLSLFPKSNRIRYSSLGKAIRFMHSQKYTVAYFVDDTSTTVYIEAVINSRRNILPILKNRDVE